SSSQMWDCTWATVFLNSRLCTRACSNSSSPCFMLPPKHPVNPNSAAAPAMVTRLIRPHWFMESPLTMLSPEQALLHTMTCLASHAVHSVSDDPKARPRVQLGCLSCESLLMHERE